MWGGGMLVNMGTTHQSSEVGADTGHLLTSGHTSWPGRKHGQAGPPPGPSESPLLGHLDHSETTGEAGGQPAGRPQLQRTGGLGAIRVRGGGSLTPDRRGSPGYHRLPPSPAQGMNATMLQLHPTILSVKTYEAQSPGPDTPRRDRDEEHGAQGQEFVQENEG